MAKLAIILLLSLGLNTICDGQSKSFAFRNISINEGLSQSSVVDIATDRLGFIWVATQDGLNRYDGKEFQVINKTFDDITTPASSTTGKLAVGNDNDLWMITSGGKLERMDLMNFPTSRLVYSERSSEGYLSTLLQEKMLSKARMVRQKPDLKIFINAS